MEAAIGREQLKKLDGIIVQRRENAKYFIEKMQDINNIRIQQEIQESSWFGFAMNLEGPLKEKRSELVKILKENKIEVRPIVAGNFTKNEAIKYLNYEISGELSGADEIHNCGFFVGNHSKSNKENIDFLISIIESFVKE